MLPLRASQRPSPRVRCLLSSFFLFACSSAWGRGRRRRRRRNIINGRCRRTAGTIFTVASVCKTIWFPKRNLVRDSSCKADQLIEALQSFIAKDQSYKPYSTSCLDVNLSFWGTKGHKIRGKLLRRRLCMDLYGVLGPSCSLWGLLGALDHWLRATLVA